MVVPAILTDDPADARTKLDELYRQKLPVHIDIIEPSWGRATLGLTEWRELRSQTAGLPEYIEWHLMVDDPLPYIQALNGMGTTVIVQVESVRDITAVKRAAADAGLDLFLTANPSTPLPYDWKPKGWQIMGVVPGAAGQAQLADTPQRVTEARQHGRDTILSVDGGITPSNAPALISAGANTLVVNSTYWKANDKTSIIRSLTAIVTGGGHGISDRD